MSEKAVNILNWFSGKIGLALLAYVTIIVDLVFLSSKFYYSVFFQAVSMLIPTVLSIFLTVTFFKKIKIGKKNQLSLMIASTVFSMLLSLILTVLLYLLLSYYGVNLTAVILNILTAGLGSIIFNRSFFKYGLYHENKLFFTIVITTIMIAFVSFLNVDASVLVSLSVFVAMLVVAGFMYYVDPAKPVFVGKKFESTLKQMFNFRNFAQLKSKDTLMLAGFTAPYIVLLNNGSILAGLLLLASIISGIIIIFWVNLQDDFKKINKNNLEGNNSKKHLIFFLVFSIIFFVALIIFAPQVLSIFNIPLEYVSQYVFIVLSMVPLTVALLFTQVFKPLTFFKNMSLEYGFTIIVLGGLLLLTRVNQIMLGVSMFLVYMLFIFAVILKNKTK